MTCGEWEYDNTHIHFAWFEWCIGKTIQCMCMNSAGKGCIIMSENINEKRHEAVRLVVKLDMIENFPWAEVI